MNVCGTKNVDLFNKVQVFESMKVYTFRPNIRLIRLFSLMLNYAKPRLLMISKRYDTYRMNSGSIQSMVGQIKGQFLWKVNVQ